jgi:hypothetical protein
LFLGGIAVILSHWCTLIDGLQASPLEFYKCVDEAVERRKVPGLARRRVLWPEGGLLSAKREYLRLTRGKLLFDICAAPFGTGFFVSCRLVNREIPWGLIAAAIASVPIFLMFSSVLLVAHEKGIPAAIGWIAFIIPAMVFVGLGIWVMLRLLHGSLMDLDRYLCTSPVLGPMYERITGRMTYYRIDTTMMFQQAVQAAVMEAVDHHIKVQGLTPLSADERKPVLSKLLMR